jgi:hypothetical protein
MQLHFQLGAYGSARSRRAASILLATFHRSLPERSGRDAGGTFANQVFTQTARLLFSCR